MNATNNGANSAGRKHLPSIILLILCASASYADRATAAPQAKAPDAAIKETTRLRRLKKIPARCRIVIVPDGAPWLLAAAVPVLEKLRGQGKRPLLLAVSEKPVANANTFLHRFPTASCLVISTEPRFQPHVTDRTVPATIVLARSPTRATFALAKRIWGTSDRVVVAMDDDDESVLTGALLAAHRLQPLLIADVGTTPHAFLAHLNDLGASRVTLVLTKSRRSSKWAVSDTLKVETLHSNHVRERIVKHLRGMRTPPRNIVVARLPAQGDIGATAFLAPYLCLNRDGIPVFGRTGEVVNIEKQVLNAITNHKLRPRSVTLLADYRSIGTKKAVVYGDRTQRKVAYELEIEPCMPGHAAALPSYVVGRIPFASRWKASLLICRGLSRDEILLKTSPRALMVANPADDGRGLPLCETVARATALEFKNNRIQIDEFYQAASKSKQVSKAAAEANLIIFQGHAGQHQIFDDPGFFIISDPSAGQKIKRGAATDGIGGKRWQLTRALRLPRGPPHRAESANRHNAVASTHAKSKSALSDPFWLIAPRKDDRLAGQPVVVLQSCSSLADEMFDRIFEQGGVAMIGSVSAIHSASGSAFIKSLCDGVVNRRETLGESLRDARNYFVCLQNLKDLRGHIEQAKSQRVALSFRLWGDPELRVFPQKQQPQRLALTRIAWTANDTLTVTLPRHRLDEVKTESYVAHMFPMSQAAGMTRKANGRAQRHLLPLYYFRLPVPSGFTRRHYTHLRQRGEKSNRAVFRLSSEGRYLYVLYFPSREKPMGKYILRFSK